MINTPPPTVPGTIPAQAPAIPPVAVPADVQAVSDQLSAVLAALKQQAVLAVTKAELDAAKLLLTLQTPQGAVTIKLPPVTPNIPISTGITPTLAVTLPSGQTVPLGDLLAQVASLPPAALKNIFLQIDKPAVLGQLPPLKILLNPQDVLGHAKAPVGVAPTAPVGAPPVSIRTTLTPIPESAVRDLGLLAQPTLATAPAQNAPTPTVLGNALANVQEKVSSLISRLVPVNNGQSVSAPVPTQTATSTAAPTSPNPNLPVDILEAPAPDAVKTIVLGATPKGEAIVRTDAGQIFSLANVRAEKPGSILFVRNTPAAAAVAEGTAPTATTETLDRLLNDLIHIMHSIDPAMAGRLGQQLQATPGPQMGGALMMIFSVLSGGALTGKSSTRNITLTNEIDKALPEGIKGKLLAMLNDDPVKLTRLVPDQIGVEWRGHQLPTPQLPGLNGPVWFYVQQHRQDQFGERGGGTTIDSTHPTRFVIDMDYTRLGHTQLEGITSSKRVDLKINTGMALPVTIQTELRNTYANAMSAYGLTGALSFSTDPPIDLDGPHSAMQVIS